MFKTVGSVKSNRPRSSSTISPCYASLAAGGETHSLTPFNSLLSSRPIPSLRKSTIPFRERRRRERMGNTSKDLLHLEHKNPSTSSLESALLVCKNDSLDSQRIKETNPHEKPLTSSLPQSQVLGKVKDFLGVISESNKRLELDAKDNSENYDIEVLTGDESQVIEMDLMLGIADLHTPEAVAAAESAISGFQPVIPLADTSSESESDTDSESESESEDNSDEDVGGKVKVNRPKSHKDNSSTTEVTEVASNKKPRKRPKIVEL